MAYIDKEALINQFDCCGGYTTYGEDTVRAIISRIELQPEVDAVKVVRCMNCKWYQNYMVGDKIQTRCFNLAGLCRVCNPNDFCNYGERK